MDPSMTIRTEEQAETIRQELKERRAKVDEARFRDRVINWTEDLNDELCTDAECELYEAFLAEENREGSDDKDCTKEECELYEKYLAQEGRQARVDASKKEIETRLNKAINLIPTGEDYDNDGAVIMGVVSKINKRRCELEADNPEAYDEWEKGTRMAIKELYMAIMYSEQCKAENKAADERRAMKNAFYSEHDYYKVVDREGKLVADEKKFDEEITDAITVITEVLCCQASYELGSECCADRKTQIRKLVHKAVYTILAGMYRDDKDDDEDESYEDFIIRKMKMTKLYLGVILVEMRHEINKKPFETSGSCIDKYALQWVKKPGITFEESLERRALCNDWGKEEMDSKRKVLADKDEEPSEGAHYLDKYVCLWNDTPGITYKEWVEEENVVLKEGKWLHDLGAEEEVEAGKKQASAEKEKDTSGGGHIMDPYVCMWDKRPGLTYKQWAEEQMEEQKRAAALMELKMDSADDMEEEEDEGLEADDSSLWRTEEWVKNQNEERDKEVENAKRELESLQGCSSGAVGDKEEECGGVMVDGEVVRLYNKGMLPFQEGKRPETMAIVTEEISEENEKEVESAKRELESLQGCSGCTYGEWMKKEKEEEKKELREMMQEEIVKNY